jgi:hypothetical protein
MRIAQAPWPGEQTLLDGAQSACCPLTKSAVGRKLLFFRAAVAPSDCHAPFLEVARADLHPDRHALS